MNDIGNVECDIMSLKIPDPWKNPGYMWKDENGENINWINRLPLLPAHFNKIPIPSIEDDNLPRLEEENMCIDDPNIVEDTVF